MNTTSTTPRPTPETDAEERRCHGIPQGCEQPMCICVKGDFARRIERERDEAREEIAAVKEVLWPDQTGLPNEHRNAAISIAAIKRLAGARIEELERQVVALRSAASYSLSYHNEDGEGALEKLEQALLITTPGHPLL